ncbi:sulfurtransferase [Corynebacterium yudongzhengii]|uniref:sulfurtransferase n=1 Tax=Corynebacterium yudongzhengii TaxID=2080740 RepID=UPI0018EEB89E|nr:rhodanese-like domain-containing protein [Corynebacterium yudongzhengii]
MLDGGLPAWKAAGFPVEEGVVEAAPGDFTARRRPELYATAEDVAEATDTGSAVVINALDIASHSQARIPGSVNVPFTDSLTSEGPVARPEEVRASYEETGALEADKPVITYSRAGIAATFDAFQLARLGREDVRVYDGSLTDWTSGDARPLEAD